MLMQGADLLCARYWVCSWGCIREQSKDPSSCGKTDNRQRNLNYCVYIGEKVGGDGTKENSGQARVLGVPVGCSSI